MKKHGFTLLELIIVLAIMIMFFGISIPLFSKLTESTKLETATRSVASTLSTARGYAITNNADYYVFFDLMTGPHSYFISNVADGSTVIEKRYKLPTGIYFFRPDYILDGSEEAIEFTDDTACFKPTGELNEVPANTSVYVANGPGSGADSKQITVEKTTGRVRVN